MTMLDTPAIAPIAIPELKDTIKKLRIGDLTAVQLRETFERAIASEDAIKAELHKKTLKELTPNGTRGMTKKRIVDSVYTDLLGCLVFMGYTWSPFSEHSVDAQRRALSTVTDEKIKEYAAERAMNLAALTKSLTNPETEDELRTFIGYKGEKALSTAQQAAWDQFQAARSQARLQQQKEEQAKVEKVELGETKMTITEGWHTKHNCQLWIVQLTEKVDRATFLALCQKARTLGGNYSSYGARETHGFQFRDMSNAQRFIGLQEKDVDRSAEVKQHQEEARENASQRLRDNAQTLRENAESKLNAPRLTNTNRRVNQANSVEADCRSDIRMAETMIRIADAIDNGTANHIKDVRAKTHVEMLEGELRAGMFRADSAAKRPYSECKGRDPELADIDHVEVFPWPFVNRTYIGDAVQTLEKLEGGDLLSRRLARYLRESSNENGVHFTEEKLDDLADIAAKLTKAGFRNADVFASVNTDYGRWKTMGILDIHTLRDALREYLPLRKPNIKADPIKAKIRSLVGVDIPGYFPTPPEVVARMIEEAQLDPSHFVMEPSAGSGHIVDGIVAAGVPKDQIECCEINRTLREILMDKGYLVACADFLTRVSPVHDVVEERYDRILMNPPFEDGADIDHVQRAYDWLKAGGRLIAIMSEGPFYRKDKKADAFRRWLEAVGGTSESSEDGAFAKSDCPTTIRTRLVCITK